MFWIVGRVAPDLGAWGTRDFLIIKLLCLLYSWKNCLQNHVAFLTHCSGVTERTPYHAEYSANSPTVWIIITSDGFCLISSTVVEDQLFRCNLIEEIWKLISISSFGILHEVLSSKTRHCIQVLVQQLMWRQSKNDLILADVFFDKPGAMFGSMHFLKKLVLNCNQEVPWAPGLYFCRIQVLLAYQWKCFFAGTKLLYVFHNYPKTPKPFSAFGRIKIAECLFLIVKSSGFIFNEHLVGANHCKTAESSLNVLARTLV